MFFAEILDHPVFEHVVVVLDYWLLEYFVLAWFAWFLLWRFGFLGNSGLPWNRRILSLIITELTLNILL